MSLSGTVCATGDPWVEGQGPRVYCKNGSTWADRSFTDGEFAWDIGVGGNTVFALKAKVVPGSDGNGYEIHKRNGRAWVLQYGAGKRIDADNFGHPWVTAGDGRIWRHVSGSSWSNEGFQSESGEDIAVGGDLVAYAVSKWVGPNMLYQKGLPSPSSWISTGMSGTSVSASGTGQPWVVSGGQIRSYY